jgi:hypothetical protein
MVLPSYNCEHGTWFYRLITVFFVISLYKKLWNIFFLNSITTRNMSSPYYNCIICDSSFEEILNIQVFKGPTSSPLFHGDSNSSLLKYMDSKE